MTAPIQQSFVNSRSQSLCSVSYRAPGRPRAVLIWHHGYGEHQGRYLAGMHINKTASCTLWHMLADSIELAGKAGVYQASGTLCFLGNQLFEEAAWLCSLRLVPVTETCQPRPLLLKP